jgi:hemerythrin-like metal-binding protein
VSQLVNSTSIETEKQNTINHIDDIISHIITHFNYEEKSLREVGYEEIQNHQKIHGHLLKRAQEIRDAVAFGKLDSLKAFAVIFEEIIVGHLLSEDMKFFPCYKVKET